MRFSRQLLWFIAAFFDKYKHIILVSFFLAALGGILTVGILPRLPQAKPVRYIGLVGRYGLAQIPLEVESKLGMGLTTLNERQEPQPGIASRWEILDDGRVYRFYLRDDLTWSDGTPVKVEDINITIPSVQLTRTDEYLEFTLPDVFAPFPTVLSKPVVKDGRLTVGKYSIADIQTEGPYLVRLVLDSEFERINYHFYSTVTQAVIAFKIGEIDQLVDLPEEPEIVNWPNVSVNEEISFSRYVAIFFNFDDPTVGQKNKEIRQAFSYAISNKAQDQVRAVSPINPNSWAYNRTVKAYDYDLTHAKNLFARGTEGNPNTLKLELSATPELLELAEKIKLDWEELGAEVEIRVVSSRPEQYQALLTSQDIPVDPDQYALWHSTQEATNITQFKDEQVDKNLEDGRRTIDQEQRRRYYLDFQRFLLEEAPAIFLYHPVKYELVRQ